VATRRLTFRYPFEGRPAPIPLAGFVSYMPDTYLKLSGVSMQAAFREKGLENLYRRLERHKDQMAQDLASKAARLEKLFNEMFDGLEVSENAQPFVDDLKLGVGCMEARQRVNSRMLIECLFLGMGIEPSAWQRRHCHLVVLERASWQAQQLFEAGDRSEAVDFMVSHPLLSALLWPAMEEALRKAPNLETLLPLRAAMSLDAHLGWLAAWDIDVCEKRRDAKSQFTCLLPSQNHPGRNPTSLLFDELKRRSRASSIHEMLDGCSDQSEPEIGDWSAGKHFPDLGKLEKLMKAHGLEDPDDTLYPQFGATKLINLLGYLGQSLSDRARKKGEPPALWPWPAYPFDHPDFESWAAARYPYWLTYHRENGEVLANLAKR
jgi:hypothetical protein